MGQLNTVSKGIISNADNSYAIRITAPISPGSSGGPIINEKGEVVGVTFASYDSVMSQNINYAITSNMVSNLYKKYRNDDFKVVSLDGSKSAECVVNVTTKTEEKISVSGVELNVNTLSLQEGNSELLTATVTPEDAEDKSVIWSTSNASVVEVDNGKVTAIGEGTATVTVITMDGGYKAFCKVEVKKAEDPIISVSGVTFKEDRVTLKSGETGMLQIAIEPSNATNQAVTFESADPEIVTVSDTGEIKAVKAGKTVIQVITIDGEKKAYCTVEVIEEVINDTIAVETVNIVPNKQELTVGESANLAVQITPSTATNQKVIWISNDESILKVEQDGKITAIKAGQTTVVAKTEDGNKLAFCDVTIKEKQQPITATTEIKVNAVNVSEKTFTLALKETKTIQTTISPSNATNKKITYASSNATVATVDANGKVKAVTPGIANITVKAASGVTAKVTVKVKPAKVTSFKKTKLSNTKVKISWKKQSKVTGYKVYRLNTKTQKYKLYKITKRNYVSVANMKKNATYTFKVKAYKRSGSAVVNGDLSKAFKVKMK